MWYGYCKPSKSVHLSFLHPSFVELPSLGALLCKHAVDGTPFLWNWGVSVWIKKVCMGIPKWSRTSRTVILIHNFSIKAYTCTVPAIKLLWTLDKGALPNPSFLFEVFMYGALTRRSGGFCSPRPKVPLPKKGAMEPVERQWKQFHMLWCNEMRPGPLEWRRRRLDDWCMVSWQSCGWICVFATSTISDCWSVPMHQ